MPYTEQYVRERLDEPQFRRCCKGKQKTSYGYKWRFKEGEIEC